MASCRRYWDSSQRDWISYQRGRNRVYQKAPCLWVSVNNILCCLAEQLGTRQQPTPVTTPRCQIYSLREVDMIADSMLGGKRGSRDRRTFQWALFKSYLILLNQFQVHIVWRYVCSKILYEVAPDDTAYGKKEDAFCPFVICDFVCRRKNYRWTLKFVFSSICQSVNFSPWRLTASAAKWSQEMRRIKNVLQLIIFNRRQSKSKEQWTTL